MSLGLALHSLGCHVLAGEVALWCLSSGTFYDPFSLTVLPKCHSKPLSFVTHSILMTSHAVGSISLLSQTRKLRCRALSKALRVPDQGAGMDPGSESAHIPLRASPHHHLTQLTSKKVCQKRLALQISGRALSKVL